MSILIKGMEMPTSCQKCPFLDYEEGFCFASGAKGKSGWYEFTLRPGEIKDRRHDDCPLIPVPPHGRLGDLDALTERFWDGQCYFTDAIKSKLQSAPTIIPAEEEDGERRKR